MSAGKGILSPRLSPIPESSEPNYENDNEVKSPSKQEQPSNVEPVFLEDPQEKKQIRFGGDEIAKKEADVGGVAAGMRLEYKSVPKTCERFLQIKNFAPLFVDDILEEAIEREKLKRKESSLRIIEGIEFQDEEGEESLESIGTYVCVLEWPTIEEFTIELGISKITEYFSYWKFEEEWKYCVNYIKGESDSTCDYYRFEVIFSIPCKQYPIPQATASVYFTYEVSRVRPRHCLVDVYYNFEGRRSVHNPGQFKLQEEWLFQIVDAKIKFFKTLTF